MNIDLQIECVKKELLRRKRRYPLLIEAEKMSEDYAELEILKMQKVMETLSQLKGLVGG